MGSIIAVMGDKLVRENNRRTTLALLQKVTITSAAFSGKLTLPRLQNNSARFTVATQREEGMMIQQNVITSNAHPITAGQTRIRIHRTLVIMMLIMSLTLMFSLYVYQASVIYNAQLTLEAQKETYASHERLNASALVLYAQTQSMDEMIRRAQASGYGPPKASQIKYVRLNNGSPSFVQSNAVASRR